MPKMSETQKKILHVGEADCSKCQIYRICHEPKKNLVPKYVQGCIHFKSKEDGER